MLVQESSKTDSFAPKLKHIEFITDRLICSSIDWLLKVQSLDLTCRCELSFLGEGKQVQIPMFISHFSLFRTSRSGVLAEWPKLIAVAGHMTRLHTFAPCYCDQNGVRGTKQARKGDSFPKALRNENKHLFDFEIKLSVSVYIGR